MYQNKHDISGLNAIDGNNAEELFRKLAEDQGYKVVDATKIEQFAHIDFWLEKDGQRWSFEIKARKKVSRQDDGYRDDLTWLEFKNVQGKDGWLVDKNGAQTLSFEQENEFIIVDRIKLLELAKKLVNFDIVVDKAKKSLNVTFRRFRRKDLLSLVETQEIRKIANKIWQKTKNSESTLNKSIKLM